MVSTPQRSRSCLPKRLDLRQPVDIGRSRGPAVDDRGTERHFSGRRWLGGRVTLRSQILVGLREIDRAFVETAPRQIGADLVARDPELVQEMESV